MVLYANSSNFRKKIAYIYFYFYYSMNPSKYCLMSYIGHTQSTASIPITKNDILILFYTALLSNCICGDFFQKIIEKLVIIVKLAAISSKPVNHTYFSLFLQPNPDIAYFTLVCMKMKSCFRHSICY